MLSTTSMTTCCVAVVLVLSSIPSTPVAAALITTNGYTVGSGLLGTTLVDEADHTDLTTNERADNGSYGWVSAYSDLWNIGDDVSLTGLALPMRSPNSSDSTNNTSNGTWTFSIYELSGGPNTNLWDGTDNGEVLLATVDVDFTDEGTGSTIIPYFSFETPVDFTASSTGIAINLSSTTSLRARTIDPQGSVAGAHANEKSGAASGRGVQWTLAGSVSSVPEPSAILLTGVILGLGSVMTHRNRLSNAKAG